MSIKRTKQRSYGAGRGGSSEDDYFAKPAEPEKSWDEHMADKTDDQFTPYAMTNRYTKGTLILHSKFGKGVVTHVEATHVQVLFQEGAKKLGHGAAS
jgi:hypothetical protein